MRKLLLATLLCYVVTFWNGTARSQIPKPIRAPFFTSDELPTPPQQNAPWPHADEVFSNAAATLFKQGLADPRGLEYREIEIRVGEPRNGGGSTVKAHGWVLPPKGEGGGFAVAWNGLVYPVIGVGAIQDLHQDWALGLSNAQSQSWRQPDASEGAVLNPAVPSFVGVALLLRLGEATTAQAVIRALSSGNDTFNRADPYEMMVTDWTWFAFERAVCAHERGDDHLVRADARLLTKAQPLIADTMKQRYIQQLLENSNPPFPDHTLLDLEIWPQLPALLADSEERVAHPQNAPQDKALATHDVTALIDDLQNVDARQDSQPGGVFLSGDPRIQAVAKCGDAAVEPLLEVLETDTRLTRSVSFHRDFFRNRNLIPVSAAAYAALVDVLRVSFKNYDARGKPLSTKEIAEQIRAYWAKERHLTPLERLYATLKDDTANPKQWLQAADSIVQPTDVEIHGGLTILPYRRPGQKIVLRGESLRDTHRPSVGQLMAQRSDALATARPGTLLDSNSFTDASQMALNLADWDKVAAVPVLKKRLARLYAIGIPQNDSLARYGDPAERYGSLIAHMTLARAQGGDLTAYDEYAAWIQRVDLRGVSYGVQDLQKPLVEGATRPSVVRAIDFLFNNPRSPWSNTLNASSGYWSSEFWGSALPLTPGFRKRALRALSDQSNAGTITFNPRQKWDGYGEADIELPSATLGYSGSNGDPDTPPAGEKRTFRVCDIYAYLYARDQKGPPIQLFWPQAKRDTAVVACRQWLEAHK